MTKKKTNRIAAKIAAMSDREVARLLRQSHRPLRRRQARRAGCTAARWTAGEDRLLGKWPDEQVARYLGRTRKAVGGRRLKLGLRRQTPPPRWTPEEERLIDPANTPGPVKNWTRELARQLGRSAVAVRMHRRLTYGATYPTPRSWSKRELRLLGTRLDREVAVMVGRSVVNVQVKRCALGIPSYRANQKHRWTPAHDRLLGKQSDVALGAKFRCDRHAVTARRRALGIPQYTHRPWTADQEKLVGTLPDDEVARRIGRTLKSVLHRRRALKLPPSNPRIRYWTAAEDRLLGVKPDAVVARQLGRGVGGVKGRRGRLGIRLR